MPLPTGNFERNYGVHSVRHSTAERVIFRVTHANRELIKEIAKELGMTEAQFCREAATNMAKSIRKHMEDHNADASDRSG